MVHLCFVHRSVCYDRSPDIVYTVLTMFYPPLWQLEGQCGQYRFLGQYMSSKRVPCLLCEFYLDIVVVLTKILEDGAVLIFYCSKHSCVIIFTFSTSLRMRSGPYFSPLLLFIGHLPSQYFFLSFFCSPLSYTLQLFSYLLLSLLVPHLASPPLHPQLSWFYVLHLPFFSFYEDPFLILTSTEFVFFLLLSPGCTNSNFA